MIEIFILILLIFCINYFFKKKIFLNNNTGQPHQIYNQENQVPLSGGIFIFIYFIYSFLGNSFFEFELVIFLTFFFILGLFADLNLIKSPAFRFVGQIILLIFFLITLEINIPDIRINIINKLLENFYINVFFVLFCFLVLINGSNFIDGNNGICIGYFLIIFIIILDLSNKDLITYNTSFLMSLLSLLFILLLFNLFNKLYLGDSGAYLLSFFSGYILIDIILKNPNISPYFIVNMFWYPAFEILFSVIRKIKLKYSPLKPDTLHFHQLLFFYLSKKNNFRKNILKDDNSLK